MASPRLLAPTLLLGLAALCGGMHLHGRRRRIKMPRPFDPADDGIIIFSRSKTGTSSLQRTAGEMLQPRCAVHYGDPEADAKPKGLSKHRGIKCHRHDCVQYFLKGRPEGSRTWVITTNRNPFTRYPSMMFQNIGHWSDEDIKRASMNDLLSYFHNGSRIMPGLPEIAFRGTFQTKLDWYTREFKEAIGLDILAHPFNFDKKFLHVQHVFDNRTLEILVLRLEDSTQWEAILKPFFPTLQLEHANLASDKRSPLASKYTEFMSVMQYTNEEIDRMSKSDELNYFYTTQEQDAFIQKARESSSRMPDILAEDLTLEDQLDLQGGLPDC